MATTRKTTKRRTPATKRDKAPASSVITSPKELLLPYQRVWANDQSRFKIGCFARQTGKDFSSAAEIAEDMIKYMACKWMIVAPAERQSLESLDKVRMWIKAYAVVFTEEVIDLDNTDFKATCIVLENGSRCFAVPGKPDTVRGYSANVLFTEFTFFENPDETWKAIAPTITNPLSGGIKKVRIISTPNGKSGKGKRFWEFLRDNYFEPKEGRKTVWSCHFVTLKEAISQGLPVDYDELAEAINDPIVVAQEMDLVFLDGCFQLLPYDLIMQSESHLARGAASGTYWEETKDKHYMGIDFGRVSDPTVAWSAIKVAGLAITKEVLVLRAMSTPDQVDIMRPRIRKARLVCVDYTGPGVGFGDLLVKEFGIWDPPNHHFGKIKLCTFTTGLKREIFPKLRTAMESRNFFIPQGDDALRDDLASMQQLILNGNYTYEAPHTKDGHSDRCTSAALCQLSIDLTAFKGTCRPGRWPETAHDSSLRKSPLHHSSRSRKPQRRQSFRGARRI